jgi:NADPH:quinone reductase
MKAIRVESFGGPEVLRLGDVPDPQAGRGQLLVRVEAAGVNFIDVYHRTGLYPNPLPLVPGQEGAGVVEQVGAGVEGFRAGDRVGWASSLGSYAERALVPGAVAVPIPAAVDARTAAAVLLQGMTAHYLCTSTYPLKQGDTCLVHAAAGGVGLLLVQLAKQRGARVIGTVGTEEKARLAREAGADEVVLYDREDFLAAAKAATGGRGVEVVYDGVGKATAAKSLDCLAPLGMMVFFGNASGPVDPIDPLVLGRKGSLFLTRPSLGHYVADRASLERRAGEVLALVAKGALRVRIGRTFPLAEAAEAHRALQGRQTTGKVLLLP